MKEQFAFTHSKKKGMMVGGNNQDRVKRANVKKRKYKFKKKGGEEGFMKIGRENEREDTLSLPCSFFCGFLNERKGNEQTAKKRKRREKAKKKIQSESGGQWRENRELRAAEKRNK